MALYISLIFTIVVSIAVTVIALIFLLPEKRRAKLGKFGGLLHDFLNVKYLLVEYILKAVYVLATVACVAYGIFMNILPEFAVAFDPFNFAVRWGGLEGILIGLLFIVLGPLVVRVVYEITMLFILLVKNTMDIRNKLCDNSNDSPFANKPDFAAISNLVKKSPAAPADKQEEQK